MGAGAVAAASVIGSAASAAGTIVGASGGSAGMTEHAQARQARQSAYLSKYQFKQENAFDKANTKLAQLQTLRSGDVAKTVANFNARVAEQSGREAQAEGILGAAEARRAGRENQSSIKAISAASGFTSTDASTMDIAQDVAARDYLRQKMLLFSGLNRRAGFDTEAGALRAAGENEYRMSRYDSKMTGLTGKLRRTVNANRNAMERAGLHTTANNYMMAAQAAQAAARRQRLASYFSAGTTLAGGAGKAFAQYA